MLAQLFVDAVAGNPAMAGAIGLSGAQPMDGMIAVTHLYIAIIATGYAVQVLGILRAEETAGRLEVRLSGTLSRMRWLAAHALVIVTGLVIIVVVSSVVLAAGTAWSMGTAVDLGRVLGAGAAYLPAELVVGRLALALFGLLPRAFAAAWAALAFVAFLALLGPASACPGGCSTSPRRPMSATPPRWAPSRRCRSSPSAPSPRPSAPPRRSASVVGGGPSGRVQMTGAPDSPTQSRAPRGPRPTIAARTRTVGLMALFLAARPSTPGSPS